VVSRDSTQLAFAGNTSGSPVSIIECPCSGSGCAGQARILRTLPSGEYNPQTQLGPRYNDLPTPVIKKLSARPTPLAVERPDLVARREAAQVKDALVVVGQVDVSQFASLACSSSTGSSISRATSAWVRRPSRSRTLGLERRFQTWRSLSRDVRRMVG
jgi:hypothetical protein